MASKLRCIVYLVTVGLAVRYIFHSDPLSDCLEDWLLWEACSRLAVQQTFVRTRNWSHFNLVCQYPTCVLFL